MTQRTFDDAIASLAKTLKKDFGDRWARGNQEHQEKVRHIERRLLTLGIDGNDQACVDAVDNGHRWMAIDPGVGRWAPSAREVVDVIDFAYRHGIAVDIRNTSTRMAVDALRALTGTNRAAANLTSSARMDWVVTLSGAMAKTERVEPSWIVQSAHEYSGAMLPDAYTLIMAAGHRQEPEAFPDEDMAWQMVRGHSGSALPLSVRVAAIMVGREALRGSSVEAARHAFRRAYRESSFMVLCNDLPAIRMVTGSTDMAPTQSSDEDGEGGDASCVGADQLARLRGQGVAHVS